MLFVEQDRAAHALRTARGLLASFGPTTAAVVACLSAPAAPFVPAKHRSGLVVALIIAGFGTVEEHAADVAAARAALPPAFETVTSLPYTALQQMLDETHPWGVLASPTSASPCGG